MLKSLEDLLVDRLVCLCEVLTSLGMADDDVLNACVHKHSRGDLACKCTALLEIHVLSSDLDVGALCCLNCSRDINRRYAEKNIYCIACACLDHLRDKSLCLRRSFIHFPVAGR